MKGSVSQMVALTACANAHLHGRSVTFDLDHETASICQSIEFVKTPRVGSLKNRTVLARDPQSWFDYLAESGVTHLRLHYSHTSEEVSPDRSTAGFAGGGGHWFIETVGPAERVLWESVWDTRRTKGNRIWKVWYVLSKVRPDELHDVPTSIEETRKELRDALLDIISFAEKHDDTKEWISCFQRSLTALDAKDDDEIFRGYLPEGCYPREARQLVAAGGRAWVFGGMGTWNDVLFGANGEILKEYGRVSDRLYDAMCKAIVAAVNSYP